MCGGEEEKYRKEQRRTKVFFLPYGFSGREAEKCRISGTVLPNRKNRKKDRSLLYCKYQRTAEVKRQFLAAAIAWVRTAMALVRTEAVGLPPITLFRLSMAFCSPA